MTDSGLILQPNAKLQPAKILTHVAAARMRREFELFIRRAWHIVEPKELVWNWHLSALADHLAAVTVGEIRNLMVMLPPRMTKSLVISVLYPVWHWLQKPQTQFITASYSADLSIRDAILARRIIESGWFTRFYPSDFFLLPDQNRKDRYSNSKGGYRIATSVGGISTGEGGDIQILDDGNNAAKVESDAVRTNALAWHDNAWRSRVNDPNKAQKIYAGQRTHDTDLLGHAAGKEGNRWTILCLPMEHDLQRVCITYPNDGTGVKKGAKPIFVDPRKKEGELLNPKRFNKETAAIERGMMSNRAWMAQYQQQPEGAGGLILKRHWWKEWSWPEWHQKYGKSERPIPNFFEVIQVYDTAFEEKQEADYTARTTWGLFYNSDPFDDPVTGRRREEEERVCSLLLDRYKDRPGFPELRQEMIRSNIEYSPTHILIEKKASGHSLVQEARRKNLPVKAVRIDGAGDLVARANMASLMLEKGCIYYVPRNWAFDVIDEAVKFPNAEHDDQVATLVLAWQYMRRYYDLTLPDDEKRDEINPFKWERKLRYA